MGYDMLIVGDPTDTEKAQLATAEQDFREACAARDALPKAEIGRFDAELANKTGDWDSHEVYPGRSQRYIKAQDKVSAAYERLSDADVRYFRLNIFGMERYRDFMLQLGMVVTDYEHGPWPEKPDGLTWDEIEAAEDPALHEDTESALPVKAEAVEYVKAREAYLRQHPEPPFGLAIHKFGSNDGWHVTPEEIEAALESYRQHSAEEVKAIIGDGLDYWCKWINYLERARLRGGFKVH